VKPLHKSDAQQLEQESYFAGISQALIMVCPECGKKMVRRTAKKGVGSGSQFWGCSGYPKCKVVKTIEA